MIKTMFVVVLLLSTISLITSSVFAQNKLTGGAGAPGCGEPKTKFEVKMEKSQHPPQTDAGKALVYFIENDSQFDSFPSPTTRMGIDGEWVGATHGNSYFIYPSIQESIIFVQAGK